MSHPTDEELDALVKRMENVSLQVGVPSRTILDSDVIRRAADSITALRAKIAAANARADLAEAALAAQIEADARIVEALYRNALGESDADLESPWKSHKASAFGIAVGAIRAQPHDRAALEPAHHVIETPKSEHDRADVLAVLPDPVTLAEALQVPEVRALVEAARKTILAAEMREAYHRLPNDRNRIGDPKSKKSKARDSWLKAFRRAALSAEIALRAIGEGEA